MTAPDNPEIGPIGDRCCTRTTTSGYGRWSSSRASGRRCTPRERLRGVVVEGDHVTVEPAESSEERSGDGYGSVEVEPGQSVFLHKGATEVAINSGARLYRDIQVELLG